MANFTEKAIRAAFLTLLEEKPLNKITVKDITDKCGINRNSFYYHYQDIPTLIHEILTSEVNRIISEYPSIDSIEKCLEVTVSFSLENRRAIMHIYNSVNRDMFERYLWRACEHTVKVYLNTAFPDMKISDGDRKALEGYHVCEIFGLVLGWLQMGMKDDIIPFLDRICEMRRGFTEEMVEFCKNSADKNDK